MSEARQLNVRLPEETLAVLEAVRFLQGKPSLQQVALEVLSQFAERRRSDPKVVQALRLRAEQLAEDKGQLRSLHAMKGGSNDEDGDSP